jgi:starvation-inducible outer membrane lipoprotein
MKKTLLVLALSVISGCAYQEPTPYQIFGIQKFQEIKRNPKPHVGKLYAFGGRVINADKKENQITFEILIQDYNPGSDSYITSDSSLLVVYPGGKTTVADDHYVKVLGYIREPAIGKNVFGANVSSLVMDAIALYDSFTRYPFWLSRDEELFNKWKTGEPFTADETQK